MEEIVMALGMVFILFSCIKALYFLKYTAQFHSIKKYFFIPEWLLFFCFLCAVILTIRSAEDWKIQISLSVLTLAGLSAGTAGYQRRNKILVVLSTMVYMYVFGICLTKNLNFMLS